MKETEQHINQPVQDEAGMPAAREQMECKRVFVRQHVPAPDVDKEWQRFMNRHRSSGQRSDKMRLWITGFAAGIAASLLLYWGISQWQHETVQTQPTEVFKAIAHSEDVMFTTESGETHIINGQEKTPVRMGQMLASADSMHCESIPAGTKTEWITLQTPRGKDYQLTLPDGTRVWLNADSRIVFPNAFTAQERLVKLEGEGYFDVASDSLHPFKVASEWFTVTALGTEFNLRAYDENDAHAVLVEGKVALNDHAGGHSQILYPGDKAQWTEDGFRVKKVDTYSHTQWREGYFYFDNLPLRDILHELGRWYNVDIVIRQADLLNTRLHFVADRKENLQHALDNLNALQIVRVIYEQERVIVQ